MNTLIWKGHDQEFKEGREMNSDKHTQMSAKNRKDKKSIAYGGISSYEKINLSGQLGLKTQLDSRGNVTR